MICKEIHNINVGNKINILKYVTKLLVIMTLAKYKESKFVL
jgi:hypothetical protein